MPTAANTSLMAPMPGSSRSLALGSAARVADPFRTRRTLLGRIAAGDDHGWKEFYALYSPLIRWHCRRRGVDTDEAQDLVVQAVMSHFAVAAWSYDDALGRFRNLVLRVAELKMHEVRRELAHPRTIPFERQTDQRLALEEDDLESDWMRRQTLLRQALEQLHAEAQATPRDLQVLALVLASRPLEEIVRLVGVTAGHARVIKHRMLTRLRQLLDGNEEDGV